MTVGLGPSNGPPEWKLFPGLVSGRVDGVEDAKIQLGCKSKLTECYKFVFSTQGSLSRHSLGAGPNLKI